MIDMYEVAKAAYIMRPFSAYQIWHAVTDELSTLPQSVSIAMHMQKCTFLRKTLDKHNRQHSWWIEEEHIQDFADFLEEHHWVFEANSAKPFTRPKHGRF